MLKITKMFYLPKRIRLLLLLACILAGILLVTLFYRGLRKKQLIESKATPTPIYPQEIINFEREESQPVIYQKTLPDGTRVEYGSRSGPLPYEVLRELEAIVEEEIKK